MNASNILSELICIVDRKIFTSWLIKIKRGNPHLINSYNVPPYTAEEVYVNT